MILRYRHHGRVQVGLLVGELVVPLADRLADLLQLSRADLATRLASARAGLDHGDDAVPVRDVVRLAPIDGRTEVWAAGVTYEVSQEARMAESESSADVYAKVYAADRPELFFKSVGWRVRGEGEPLRVRADSPINVPEPELALLINAHQEVVGYGVCNDMSSRSIEADNPLYLPQAKIYRGSCSLGSTIRPSWEIEDPRTLPLKLRIERSGQTVWQGEASVGQLHRELDDLVNWLHRELAFPDGVWLSTGTCLVPDLPFTVLSGDVIMIEIDGVGTLTNPVSS